MKNKIKTPSQEIGKLSVKKLEDWLKTSPEIPIHNRKMDKTKICRMHKITKSTIDSNSGLQSLFSDDGPIAKLAQEQLTETISKQVNTVNKTIRESNDITLPSEQLTQTIEDLKQTIESIYLDLASEEYLTSTGRYIPKLYLKDLED